MSDPSTLAQRSEQPAEPRDERPNRQSKSMSVLPSIARNAEAPLFYPRSVARYQRIRALGEGGAGEVDLWHDQDIDRDVAVKRLKRAGINDSLAKFVREIQTTGQLQHPSIVPIYDVGIDEEGRYFFVMKHVEGETLEQIIAKLREGDSAYKQRYSYEARAQIFMQVLRAVQYAHRKGFLHCDIKPADVEQHIYRRKTRRAAELRTACG